MSMAQFEAQKGLKKTIALLGIVLLNIHWAKTQSQKTDVFNTRAFQRTQEPQEYVKNSNNNLHLTTFSAQKTAASSVQKSPQQIYAQGDTTYVSGNPNFHYRPNSQEVYSNTFSDARNPSLSFIQNPKTQQYNSAEDSTEASQDTNLQEYPKSSPEMLYQKAQGPGGFSRNDNHNANTVYLSGKTALENTTIAHLKTDPDEHFGTVQSERVRKVPIVLITIQKGQNGSPPKERTDLNSNVKSTDSDKSSKYNKNHTNIQGNNFRYYSPAQINTPSDQTVLNKVSNPNSPVDSKNVVDVSGTTNSNAFRYSIPQTTQYPRNPDWQPMDRANIQTYDSKVTAPNYKQEKETPEFRSYSETSQENQQNAQLRGNQGFPFQVYSRSQHLPLQQPNRHQASVSKSGVDSDSENYYKATQRESAIKSYGDIHKNNKQNDQTFYQEPEGHVFLQNYSTNGITSFQRQSNFQNVTFPTTKENHSPILSQDFRKEGFRIDTSHKNSHSDNSRKYSEESKIGDSGNQKPNQGVRIQNQNNNYFLPNSDKNLLGNGGTLPLQSKQIKTEQFRFVNNDGRTSHTQMVNAFQVTPMPELRTNSRRRYQDMFTVLGQEVILSNSRENEPSSNQNFQEEPMSNGKHLVETTGKKSVQNSGYVIFPLDGKYTVQNDGHSGKGISLVLDKLSSAYDPVKNLFMYQNANSHETNSRNFYQSSKEEAGDKEGAVLYSKQGAVSFINFGNSNLKNTPYVYSNSKNNPSVHHNSNNYPSAYSSSNNNNSDNSNSKSNPSIYSNSQNNPSDYINSKNNPSTYSRASSLPQGNGHFSSGFESHISHQENRYITPNKDNFKSGNTENSNQNVGMIRPVNFRMFQKQFESSRESSEEQKDTLANLPFQYEPKYNMPTNSEFPQTSAESYSRNSQNEKNKQQFHSSHPEYIKHNSYEDTNEHSLKFQKENGNSDTISPPYGKITDKLHHNPQTEVRNVNNNKNFPSKEFQISLGESSNFKKNSNKRHDSRSSSPEALLLVLVSEKSSYANDDSSTEDNDSQFALESSSKKLSTLLGDQSNAKSLLETLYSASTKDMKQTNPVDTNKKTSSQHRIN